MVLGVNSCCPSGTRTEETRRGMSPEDHPRCRFELCVVHVATQSPSPLRIFGSISSVKPAHRTVSIRERMRSPIQSKGADAC
jgi:hypothetical protein